MASIYSFWATLFDNKSSLERGMELVELAYGDERVFVNDNLDYQLSSLVSIIPIDQALNQEEEKYYLIRGSNNEGSQKICLVSESFFGTVRAEELSKELFHQIIDEKPTDFQETRKKLTNKDFGHIGAIEKSSVALKYQVEVEVKPQLNIFDSFHYPEILDDTLNLICPFHSEDEKEELISNVASVVGTETLSKLHIFPIKHPLNVWFLVFQTGL